MGIVNLYKAIRKKLDDWKDNYPSDCGFMIKANEYIIEGMSSFEESYYLVMVDISYKSYNGVSKFFRMEYKENLRSVRPEIEEIISEKILSELSNLLDKGILDSVKDGTFRGWGV
ncbi:hypothetical protein [Kolpuevirus frurule]|uniref:Uncharacterized protein n=1 Tax=Kolpuevirus sp. 'frurule' TaxID=3028514 RepID=A0AAF0DRY8_9CAUD|nr:hypothetical protein [Kolpuevirus sp. 'frurule']